MEIQNWLKKSLNKLKFWLIEIMTIAGDMYQLRKCAKEMAEEETLEEFDRRYTTKFKLPPPELSEGGTIFRCEERYMEFIKENKAQYDEMLKELYSKNLLELKRMWYFKNLDKLLPQDESTKSES